MSSLAVVVDGVVADGRDICCALLHHPVRNGPETIFYSCDLTKTQLNGALIHKETRFHYVLMKTSCCLRALWSSSS